MARGIPIPFTKKQEKFILANYLLIPTKRLANQCGCNAPRIHNFLKKHGLEIPQDQREIWKKAAMFQNNHKTWNKGKPMEEYMTPEAIAVIRSTQFKKGQPAKNEKYNGYERITKEGYVMVRVAKGKFKLKHRLEWQEKIGPLKSTEILVCRSDNPRNTDPSNWDKITREENMLRNSRHEFIKELVPTMALISNLKKTIKKRESNGKEQNDRS
jgi:hypothetical protein